MRVAQTKPQEQHSPGKDAAAGSGYTTGLEGCQLECIQTAKVSASGMSAEFTVKTHMPTRMWVIITGVGIKDSGNQLTTAWQPAFSGLKADTRHDVTIAAEDTAGHARHIYGSFKTLRRMALVHFDRVGVIFDADDGVNRGELRFLFEVAGKDAGVTPEEKVSSGPNLVLPGRGDTIGRLVENAPRQLSLRVYGVENDYTGRTFKKLREDCYSPWTEMSNILAGNGGSCWDTARADATYDLVDAVAPAGALPNSAEINFGFTTDGSKPKFTAYGTIDVWYE